MTTYKNRKETNEMNKEEMTRVNKFFLGKMHEAHAGQKRRNGTPFSAHPNRVGNSADPSGTNPVRRAAGYGHDILEDTEYTAEHLLHDFENLVVDLDDDALKQERRIDFRHVMNLVEVLTHDKENESYLEYLTRVRDSGPDAIAIKKADIMDNFYDKPTAIEMVKYPAALLFLAGLDGDSPGELLRILEAGKRLLDAGRTMKKI